MTDLAAAEHQWQDWIREACEAVGVDPALVDVAGVHELTRDIAHGFSRPMAPVGAFIWGVAIGQAASVAGSRADGPAPRPGLAPDRLRGAIARTVASAASRA